MGEIDQGLPLLEEVEAKADKVEDIEYQYVVWLIVTCTLILISLEWMKE